jgi:hypothetical protein
MISTLSPRSLALGERRISPATSLVRAILLVALLAMVNCFPRHLGVVVTFGQPGNFVPLLGTEFRIHLPWLNAWIGLALLVNLGYLVARHESLTLSLSDLCADLFGVSVLTRMLVNGPVIGADLGAALAEHPALVRVAESALPSLTLLSDLALALAILGLLLHAGHRVFVLLTRGI